MKKILKKSLGNFKYNIFFGFHNRNPTVFLKKSAVDSLIFNINFIGTLKGKWGDKQTKRLTNSKVSAKISNSLEIRNISDTFLSNNNLYVFSSFPIQDETNEQGIFIEKIGKFAYIPNNNSKIGGDDTLFLELDSFNSYQFIN